VRCLQLHSSNFRHAVRHGSCRRAEHGVIITLVAVFMLFVIGAMAALSIDVVTLYTARSEAQLAADAGALAGARALANSGMTSDTTGGSIPQAEIWAQAIATQVAGNNLVGGRNLNSGSAAACTSGFPAGQEICVSFNDTATSFQTDPQVTVRVQRTDLPTFFARIWGSTQIKVAAVATAEAYNPSGVTTAGKSPVAPTCVKPWLLPNIHPNSGAVNARIFDPATGAILDTNLLGYQTQGFGPSKRLQAACSPDCSSGLPAASSYHYYPGDPATTFPPPTQQLPNCSPAISSAYQESVAGCIQTPISCNSTANIDMTSNPTRNGETLNAVDCLTHTQNGKGDRYDNAGGQGPPFQFIAGDDNPVAGAAGQVVIVSDSIVTVPVFDIANGATPSQQVTVIGFLQLFLNPAGTETPPNATAPGSTRSKVINLVGCGLNATGQPILGNGASPVAVRLISQ